MEAYDRRCELEEVRAEAIDEIMARFGSLIVGPDADPATCDMAKELLRAKLAAKNIKLKDVDVAAAAQSSAGVGVPLDDGGASSVDDGGSSVADLTGGTGVDLVAETRRLMKDQPELFASECVKPTKVNVVQVAAALEAKLDTVLKCRPDGKGIEAWSTKHKMWVVNQDGANREAWAMILDQTEEAFSADFVAGALPILTPGNEYSRS